MSAVWAETATWRFSGYSACQGVWNVVLEAWQQTQFVRKAPVDKWRERRSAVFVDFSYDDARYRI